MTFGSKIKELRKAKNLTLQDISQTSGLCVMTLSNLERGKYKPNDVTVSKLSKSLGCSFKELWELLN